MQMSFSRNKQRGFTLIELLVVIAIIGVLASIVLVSLNTARAKARDARRISDLRQLQLALEIYADQNAGKYPTAISLLSPGQISKVPTDPVGNTNYSYSYRTADQLSYHLGASLEDANNNALNSDADAAADAGFTGDFGGADAGKCNTADAGSACYDLKP
ncbi:type II secretion system protein [Candidatus Azambacteria bacterium]|nr:type II secretion system protein [Candidatus Azambacteria bacterium]